MEDKAFNDFLKILELYRLKTVPRTSSNNYHDEKDDTFYRRRETDAEHVYSGIRLAHYFMVSEEEFKSLDPLKVLEEFMFHDDTELITRDVGIAETKKREGKEEREKAALRILFLMYPQSIKEKLILSNHEFNHSQTAESSFARAIDKMDALVHELQYPEDWGPKGFDEKKVRELFQSSFEYSPTFMSYFEKMIEHLNSNGYFRT